MRNFLAVLLLCFAAAAPVNAANVTITYGFIQSNVYDGSLSDIDNSFSPAFGTFTLDASLNGTFSSTDVNWQDTGSGALFNFDFSHVRTGAIYSYAQSYTALQFQVGQFDSTYSLSGLYSMIGPASGTYAHTYLYDLGTGNYSFYHLSYSDNTANESFILGENADGDSYNDTFGSLTGTLLAGHTYELYFANYIQAYPLSDFGATATGCLTLSIDGASSAGDCGAAPAPVPLPAAAWLLLSGLAGLGFVGRRKAS